MQAQQLNAMGNRFWTLYGAANRALVAARGAAPFGVTDAAFSDLSTARLVSGLVRFPGDAGAEANRDGAKHLQAARDITGQHQWAEDPVVRSELREHLERATELLDTAAGQAEHLMHD